MIKTTQNQIKSNNFLFRRILMRKHIAITLCIFLSCTSIVIAEEKMSNQEQTSIALDILRMYIDSSRPSPDPIKDVIDPTPLPEADLTNEKINQAVAVFVKSFYLKSDLISYSFNNSPYGPAVEVISDFSLLPNNIHSTISIEWNSIKSKNGVELIHQKGVFNTYNATIPINKMPANDSLSEAKGKATIKTPLFLKADFSASDINKTVKIGDYEFTLLQIENDYAGLKVNTKEGIDLSKSDGIDFSRTAGVDVSTNGVEIIPIGKTGRLHIGGASSMPASEDALSAKKEIEESINEVLAGDKTNKDFTKDFESIFKSLKELETKGQKNERIFTMKVKGTIDHLLVFIPKERVTSTVDVTAIVGKAK
jgi:hypothetical protein